MSKPLIGLNFSIDADYKPPFGTLSAPIGYSDGISRAGGIPVFLPPYEDAVDLEAALTRLDGFCFIGGDDYLPEHYGGRTQKGDELMPIRRDTFDWMLAQKVLKHTQLPVLGVCGGQQLLNIALGGGLIQDIPSEWTKQSPLLHARSQRSGEAVHGFRHTLKFERDSLLARATGANKTGTLQANSYHHQSVHPDKVGKGLRITAWAEDGVVEAIEAAPDSVFAKTNRFVLGVQWHPERCPSEPQQCAIFQALVEAAKNHKR